MTHNFRIQLTLFVEQNDTEIIEQIRQKYNPLQFELIKAHVTLCREDEIENLEKVLTNLSLFSRSAVVIEFGKATRFDNGEGVLLPAMNDNEEFKELRKQVLAGITDNPGKQEPHITLMHPRNSTCTDFIFEQIDKANLPTKLKFEKISLIEQKGIGPWKILKNFDFKCRI